MNESPSVHVALKDSLFNRKIVTVSLLIIIIVLIPFALYVMYFLLQPGLNQGVYLVDYNVDNHRSSGLPWLGLSLHNLGEKSVIAVRAELNDTFIPFSFEFSHGSIKPSQTRIGSVPLQWFDAQLNEVVGFTPIRGETYFGRLNILFDDGIVITRNMNFTANGGILESFASSGAYIQVDANLFVRGSNGGLCSIVIRNLRFSENISDITILINDEIVMETSTNLRGGMYWAGSGTLPYPVYTHQTYNVTVQTQTSDGDTRTLSRTMSPEHLLSFSSHEEQ